VKGDAMHRPSIAVPSIRTFLRFCSKLSYDNMQAADPVAMLYLGYRVSTNVTKLVPWSAETSGLQRFDYFY
jgi:hypothetical protein